jgi:hypothetical protein
MSATRSSSRLFLRNLDAMVSQILSLSESDISAPISSTQRKQFCTELGKLLLPEPDHTTINARAQAVVDVYSYMALHIQTTLSVLNIHPRFREVIEMKTRLFLKEIQDGKLVKVRHEILAKLNILLKVATVMCERVSTA